MGWIHKRERKKGTVYRAIVRITGYPQQQKTFNRLTDAKLWVQQTEASIRTGEFKNVVKTAASKTLNDVIARFRREIFIHRAESTKRAEASFLNYWERELGQYALSYITPDLVSEKMAELAESGDGRLKNKKSDTPSKPSKPKSRKTLKHYRDTLAVLFKHAVQWGWIGNTPLDGVNKITKIRNERIRYLSDEERKRLLEACQESDNGQLYPVVIFALSTGSRKSEILNLSISDIDLNRQTAVLRNTKNGDTRAVPVVHHLHDLLTEQVTKVNEFYDSLDEPAPKRWLFPRRDGLEPIDIRKAWENARDAAGIDDFRFHDLRHSTASYLAMNGASLVEIAEILGHRTLQMVRRYAHLSESHVKGVVQQLNEKLF